jgi:hypothetical protein
MASIITRALEAYLCEFDFRYNYRAALGFGDTEWTTTAVQGPKSG